MSVQTLRSSRIPDPHAWIGTETVKSRVGEFEFRNGYPANDAALRLRKDHCVYAQL